MSTVLAGVFLLGVLVFVHELGHFLVAKASGVRVLTFSLGFGPRLFGFRRGDTDYRVSAIPLGGYVRMYGDDPAEDVPDEEKGRSFLHKPIPQKSAIAFAGPFANFLLPVLLFFFLFVGSETVPTGLVGTVVPGDPAAEAGMLPGDRIVAVDGQPVTTFTEVQERIEEKPGQPMQVEVERGNERLTLTLTPRGEKPIDPLQGDEELGRVGIMPGVRRPFVAVAPGSPAQTAGLKDRDLIEKVNGDKVTSTDELFAALARHRGDDLVLEVRSGLLEPPLDKPIGAEESDDDEAQPQEPPAKEPEQQRTVTIPVGPVIEPGTLYPQPVEAARYGVTRDELADAKIAGDVERTRRLLREAADDIAARRGIASYDGTLQAIAHDSVAQRIGVDPGDRVVAVDGAPLHLGQSLRAELLAEPDEVHVVGLFTEEGEARLLVFRMEGGKRHGEEDFKMFGAYPAAGLYTAGETTERDVGVGEAVSRAAERTWGLITFTLNSFAQLLTLQVSPKALGGPLTIVRFAGQAAEAGIAPYVQMMALISVNLGIINLLPIPVLDGGHLLMFAIEGVTRRRIDLRTRERATKIGLGILLVLIVFALVNDFLRLL